MRLEGAAIGFSDAYSALVWSFYYATQLMMSMRLGSLAITSAGQFLRRVSCLRRHRRGSLLLRSLYCSYVFLWILHAVVFTFVSYSACSRLFSIEETRQTFS